MGLQGALPRRWIESGPGSSFRGQAQPGEFYVFQIGLFAARERLDGNGTVTNTRTAFGSAMSTPDCDTN
ncbi:MAG: hypothetical protein IIB56_06565 [Planctomycetes bacterium]|nr:hypothetical protein [Planctomycetota bacterium]